MSAWAIRAGAHDGRVIIELLLRGRDGWLPWVEVPSVRAGQPREAQLAARVVAGASHGAISRGRVLRAIRALEEAA